MPVVTKAYTPANVIEGPADIYLDVAAPASAVPPVAGTNTLTLDTNGQPIDDGTAGFHLGLSDGPATLSVTPKFDEIRSDQFGAPVDAAFVSLDCEIDIIVKETVLQHLQRFFSSPLGTYYDLPAGTTNPAADFLQIGAPKSGQVTTHTLVLISPRREVSGKFWYVMAYRAALKSVLAMSITRKSATVYKLKFYCLADTSRVPRDQVLQIVKTL